MSDVGAASDIDAWLNKLGAMHTEEIRKILNDEGVAGQQGISDSCPISNFIHEMTGMRVRVYTSHYFTYPFSDPSGVVPDSVGDFVTNFDKGQYPELEI